MQNPVHLIYLILLTWAPFLQKVTVASTPKTTASLVPTLTITPTVERTKSIVFFFAELNN